MFKQLHADRLIKLAEHLEGGKLGLEWDFGQCRNVTNTTRLFRKPICKTVGCAIGDCATVFGKEWGEPVINWHQGQIQGMAFFGLNHNEFLTMFYGARKIDEVGKLCAFNLPRLPYTASPFEVARQIRSFVPLKLASLENPQERQATLVECSSQPTE